MRSAFALALALLAGVAWAQDPDAAALSLPASAPLPVEKARTWQLFIEGAAGRSEVLDSTPIHDNLSTQRLSLDLQVDAKVASDVRVVFADRFDVNSQNPLSQRQVNTLKEAYLSWQPRGDVIFDLGRVNQYSGVAIGYNPTDFFRAGALRSMVSVDPGSIKKNRQGSVMLRGQVLWDGSSLTALYSPALSDQPSSASFNLDWGATNGRNRGLLIFSKRLSEDINPQWLLYNERGSSPQVGMNLTKLVNDATVAYLEWSGGRSTSLLAQALGTGGSKVFRNRVATGLTYTTSNKLSLTFEYQYNGTGLEKAQWDALPWVSLPAYIGYRQFVQSAQEMPTRRAAFFYATWQDMLISHLDLSAMLRRNSADHSRLSWAELRYRWPRDEIALQWLSNSGGLFSDYGASPLRKGWQVSYRHFF